MTDSKTYIKEGLKIIKMLIDEGNLASALNSCEELLKVDPYDKEIHSLLKKIEEKIIKKNTEKADRDIATTMHLWDEKKFDELMAVYAELIKFVPDHARLKSLIEKLSSAIGKEQRGQRADFIKRSLTAIENLISGKRFGDAIQALNELLGIDPLNSRAKSFFADAKRGLIEQRLRENAGVLESADSDRVIDFLNTLKSIDPEYQKVKSLMASALARASEQKLLERKIYINESIERMKKLFNEREYEKSAQACEEILRIDPKNLNGRAYMAKAISTIKREIDEGAVKRMKDAALTLAPEFAKNHAAFARV